MLQTYWGPVMAQFEHRAFTGTIEDESGRIQDSRWMACCVNHPGSSVGPVTYREVLEFRRRHEAAEGGPHEYETRIVPV